MDKRARRIAATLYIASGQRGFPTGNPAGAGSGGLPNPAVCGAPAADGIPRSKI
ncbi:hypothetical protein LZD91_002149 [Neisseria gonorrhoeae]